MVKFYMDRLDGNLIYKNEKSTYECICFSYDTMGLTIEEILLDTSMHVPFNALTFCSSNIPFDDYYNACIKLIKSEVIREALYED